ncbi:MAG: ASKHA domain-containing protein, partial [Woeseiaceae bacterium]
ARAEIETVVRNIEKIETAVEPKFQEYFVDAMAIPNSRDPYPILFSVVDRPDGESVSTDNKPPRRRRAKRAS